MKHGSKLQSLAFVSALYYTDTLSLYKHLVLNVTHCAKKIGNKMTITFTIISKRLHTTMLQNSVTLFQRKTAFESLKSGSTAAY